MIPLTGQCLLPLALLASLYLVWRPGKSAAAVMAAFMTAAFGLLVYAFAASDFSVKTVFENSHTAKPLLYKITGTWGNHEGSMLLFAWLLALATASFGKFSSYRAAERVLSTQGLIISGVLAYIIFTSNPFSALFPIPAQGRGLNPLLQDIGLALHPPALYVGYAGLSLAFSHAIAALSSGQMARAWAASLKPWLMLSWSFLTLGIGLGSWWAYRELGWGGFWFWDPVENSSLLPWLAATALIHSLAVTEKRAMLKSWTLFLCLTAFSLSLMGFFLVRSGVLTSVHSFASDPTRGMAMLILLGAVMTGGYGMFLKYAGKFKERKSPALVSREGWLMFNNAVLLTLCVTVLLGVLYPVLLELFSERRVSVGPPYFNKVFVPVALLLLALLGIGQHMPWRRAKLGKIAKAQAPYLAISLISLAGIWLLDPIRDIAVLAALFLGMWLFLGTLVLAMERRRYASPAFLPMLLGHGGLALLVLSIAVFTGWQKDMESYVKEGDTVSLGDYSVRLERQDFTEGPNYVARRGLFVLYSGGRELGALEPENRVYLASSVRTTEAAIHMTAGARRDIYLVMGGGVPGKGTFFRLHIRPAAPFIWLACVIMASAGLAAAAWKKQHEEK